MKVLVINGPNLKSLGYREPKIYGDKNWETTIYELNGLAKELGLRLEYFQSDHEGDLIEKIWEDDCPLIINAGGYSHTSVALYDALKSKNQPTIEVHLTNIFMREPFRRQSMIAGAVTGFIAGLGTDGYVLALRSINNMIQHHNKNDNYND